MLMSACLWCSFLGQTLSRKKQIDFVFTDNLISICWQSVWWYSKHLYCDTASFYCSTASRVFYFLTKHLIFATLTAHSSVGSGDTYNIHFAEKTNSDFFILDLLIDWINNGKIFLVLCFSLDIGIPGLTNSVSCAWPGRKKQVKRMWRLFRIGAKYIFGSYFLLNSSFEICSAWTK